MATTASAIPKAIDPQTFSPRGYIRPEQWADMARTMNFCLANIGMGQVIGQCWGDGKLLFEGDGNPGDYELFTRPYTKPVYNQMKADVWVKCSFDYVTILGLPATAPRISFQSRTSEGVPHHFLIEDIPVSPMRGSTPANGAAKRVWVHIGELPLPEGDIWELQVRVVNQSDTYTYIENISVSYMPLWEDDGDDNYNVVYEPSEDTHFALDDSNVLPDIGVSPLAFPVNVSRLIADRPVSAWLGQSMQANIMHLHRRQRTYFSWTGLQQEAYDIKNKFGFMPAHYTVGLYLDWYFLPLVETASGDVLRAAWPRYSKSSVTIQHDSETGTDYDYFVYVPQGTFSGRILDERFFRDQASDRITQGIRLTDGGEEVKVWMVNSTSVRSRPFVALPGRRPVLDENSPWRNETQDESNFLPGNPFRPTFIRMDEFYIDGGVPTAVIGYDQLIPWGLISFFEHVGL